MSQLFNLKLLLISLSVLVIGCGSNSSDPSETTNTTDENGTEMLADSLNVVSWGGLFEQTQIKAIYEPWTVQTGVPVTSTTYNGTLDELRSKVNSGNVEWDLIDLEAGAMLEACEEGLIDPIDLSRLPPALDGTAASDDFKEGTLVECGVANVIWSHVIVYNTNSLTTTPTSAADFFNIDDFPGKRSLRKSPHIILEMALLADGVVPEDVYKTLASDGGWKRAIKQLDRIKDNIVWWSNGVESIDLMNDQEAVMGITYNGRAFDSVYRDQSALAVLWDGQIWDLDYWTLPSGSERRETAYNFLAYATGTEAMARQASYIPYGTPRNSSQSQIGMHAQYGVDMKPLLPTSPQNLQNALRFDTEFWNANEDRLRTQFDAWLESI